MNTVYIEEPVLQGCLDRLKEHLKCSRIKAVPHSDWKDGTGYRIQANTRPPLQILGVLRQHKRLIPEQVRHITLSGNQLKRIEGKELLFMAPWIADEWGNELRRAGIWYADTLGNAWLEIDHPRVLIDVRGRRPDRAPKAMPGRLVEPSGLKVIHRLLTWKEAIHEPYRVIADGAGVSLGTVSIVMRELQAAGNLGRAAKGRRTLTKASDLVELFVRGYGYKLRPDCFVGRYRHQEQDPLKLLERLALPLENRPEPIPYAVTGAWAAHELTAHLRAETLTLHVERGAFDAWKGEPMLPDAREGNLILMDYFAPGVLDPDLVRTKKRPLATQLLIYAELLHDGRPRELETAKIIYDRYLSKLLR